MANYLSDKPANRKSNKYPAHERIANVIYEDISQDVDSGCRRIALVGEWGSGKSTIVSMVQEKFHGETDVCFLQFDLWSHTGDSLRRSFLSKLNEGIKQLVERGKLDAEQAKDWEELDSKIDYSEQTVLTIEKRDYSSIAIIVLLIAFLYSSLSVLAGGVASALNDPSNLFVIWSPLAAIVLSVAITGVFYLLLRKSNKSRPGALKGLLSDLMCLLGGKPDTQSTRTTQTELLGSLSYEKYLVKLLKLAKSALPNGRLIVVLDNLDRLTPDNARAAWDTIQVFANQMDVADSSRIDSWLILPVSAETIGVIEGNENSINGNGTLSKLFIVRYEIPSPIRSEWKTSVYEDIASAFPESTPEARQFIFSVMNRFSDGIASRRPRDNKRVINEIVSLSRVYSTIPLESIAVFVWHRDRFDHLAYHENNPHLEAGDAASSEQHRKSFAEYIAIQISSASTLSGLPKPSGSTYKPEHLAMLVFGLFEEEAAEEAMLSVLLDDQEWVEKFDLEKQLYRSPALLDTLSGIIESSLSLKDPAARYRFGVLLGRIFASELSEPAYVQSRDSALPVFASMLDQYAWPLEKGAGAVIGTLLVRYPSAVSIGGCLRGIELASEDISSFDNAAISEWVAEIASFCEQAVCKVDFGDESLSVDFGPNLYPFIEAASATCYPAELLDLFEIDGDQAIKNIVAGLVSSRPAANGRYDVGKALSLLPIFANSQNGINFSNPGSLGLNNSDAQKAFFVEGWLISRFGGVNATAYIQQNSSFNFSDVSNDSSVFYVAAAVASYIQGNVASNRMRSVSFGIDELDEDLIHDVAKLYLLGIEGKASEHDYIGDVFNAESGSEGVLAISDALADAAASDSLILMRVPYASFAGWIVSRKVNSCQEYAGHISAAYTADEVCSAPFSVALSSLYLWLVNSSEEYHPWILNELNAVSEADWEEDLFGNDMGLSELAVAVDASSGQLACVDSVVRDRLGSSGKQERFEVILALQGRDMLRRLSDDVLAEIASCVASLFAGDNWKMQYAQIKQSLIQIDLLSRLNCEQLRSIVIAIVSSRALTHIEWLNKALNACEDIDSVKSKCQPWLEDLNKELSKKRKDDPKDLDKQFEKTRQALVRKG